MDTSPMKHPYERLSPRVLWGVYWLAFTANFIFQFGFTMGGHQHTPEAVAAGVHFSTLDLELAASPERVAEILDALGEKGRESMAWGATVQMIWPFFYANALAAGIVALYRGARFKGKALAFARTMAWGAWLAGAADFIENPLIILMLNGTFASPLPEIKYVITIVKFGSLLIALTYLLIAVGWNFKAGVLRHPLCRINAGAFPKTYTALFAAMLLIAVLLGALAKPAANQADANGKTYDVVAFEFAKTPAKAQHMLDTWGADGIAAVKINSMVDFIFMPVYSTLIAMGILALASGAGFTGLMAFIAITLAWAQWLAALCDATENAALLAILYGSAASPWPEIAYWCASVKFGIIFAGVFFILGLLPCAVRLKDAETL